MRGKGKQFNPQSMLEAVALAAVVACLAYALISKQFLVYVTPRMTPYLIGAVIVLSIWAGGSLTRLFRPIFRARVLHSFVLIVPLLLLLLPHGDVSASASGFSSGDTSLAASATKTESTESAPANADAAREQANQGEPQDVPLEEIAGLDRQNKTITLTTDDFYDWILRLYNETTTYVGYTVRVTGYVISGSDVFAPDEFALARLMMTCCVADLSPVGFICHYEQAGDLVADEWISVEGTLTLGIYEVEGQQYQEPQLQVTSVTPAEKIAGYVYPFS